MPSNWKFSFVGGRFDGYTHAADPAQITPRQKPPAELHLWEEDEGIRVRERGEPDIDGVKAERYCLRSINRKKLIARYEHESIHSSGGGEVAELVKPPAERQLEPMAA